MYLHKTYEEGIFLRPHERLNEWGHDVEENELPAPLPTKYFKRDGMPCSFMEYIKDDIVFSAIEEGGEEDDGAKV